jgi:glyoxylase-like metal-dependent hydrolase (beta-lactamase superfamily II)
MQIERFYLGCLAHASYFVHDAGEAAVIDPQRDVDLYVNEAKKLGVRIRWVIETHLHADFVSGHLELANRTGATICLGPKQARNSRIAIFTTAKSCLWGKARCGFFRLPATRGKHLHNRER